MGLTQGKFKSCPESPNPCACSCINCSIFSPLYSSPNTSLVGRGFTTCHYCGYRLPDRTTAFSGHPFYSCQHHRKKSKFSVDKGSFWFTDLKTMADKIRGLTLLRDSVQNKDLAFTMREREAFGIKGLLPPAIRSQELQARVVMDMLRSMKDDLSKYMYLRDIQDTNERLFYRVLCQNTQELMPIVYTPVVGEACIKFSYIYKQPRGLYITVHDAGHIASILGNWPQQNIKAICVTDGERILGLGDLGANGMGIPIGKLSLYTALAGIPPHLLLPVTIDVGTNNETLLNDPYYIGLKQKRTRGPQYEDLLDEFMEAVVKKWGRSCLIQFEDFGNANAFHLLEKYKNNYCTFNDDIQGTASVTVAGIIAACKQTSTKIQQHTYVFLGAGEAALGIAEYLVLSMVQDGVSVEEARSKIWLIDSKGLITVDRPAGGVSGHKKLYAKAADHIKTLEDVIDLVKPTALIGVAAQAKAFSRPVLRKMASYNKRPLIFALSNPTSKAECTAEEAYQETDGRCIFASGSPFNPVTFNGQTYCPGQGNNAYIFPGVSLAVMACNVHHIPDETFLVAAKALAEQVSREDFLQGRVYPPLERIREVCLNVAAKCTQYFFVESLATVRPEPEDKLLYLKGKQYDYFYDSSCNGNLNMCK